MGGAGRHGDQLEGGGVEEQGPGGGGQKVRHQHEGDVHHHAVQGLQLWGGETSPTQQRAAVIEILRGEQFNPTASLFNCNIAPLLKTKKEHQMKKTIEWYIYVLNGRCYDPCESIDHYTVQGVSQYQTLVDTNLEETSKGSTVSMAMVSSWKAPIRGERN